MAKKKNKENILLQDIICKTVDSWSNVHILNALIKGIEDISESKFKDLTKNTINKRIKELENN